MYYFRKIAVIFQRGSKVMKKMLILVCVLYALVMAAGMAVSATDGGTSATGLVQER